MEQDFVSSVVEGYGPKRPTLKPEAVPTVFCFSQPAKHRKLSKMREARALHRSIIDDLLSGSSVAPQSSTGESQLAIRDIGIQCG